jgi:hypothetical protein
MSRRVTLAQEDYFSLTFLEGETKYDYEYIRTLINITLDAFIRKAPLIEPLKLARIGWDGAKN